jgi:hypothetical protein
MYAVRLDVITIKLRSIAMSRLLQGAPALSRLGWALALGLCALGAQAQSGYTLNTLKASNSLGARPALLDDKNNALGTAQYYDGYGLLAFGASGIPTFGGFGFIYVPEPSKWAASTSATVTPTRLVKGARQALLAASPDGSKLLTFSGLYEASTGKLISYLPNRGSGEPYVLSDFASPRRVSNDGRVAASLEIFSSEPFVPSVKRAGVLQGVPLSSRVLPWGNNLSAAAGTVSPTGVIGGMVVEPQTEFQRAAIWVNEQLTVLDTQPNRGSAVQRINAAGEVLMCTLQGSSNVITNEVGSYIQTVYRNPVHVVWRNGVERVIQPLVPGEVASALAINASGTVVGRSGPASPPAYQAYTPQECIGTAGAGTRAFIWRDGVTTDLSTWVTSKGVRLPAGSVLVDAYEINDQGSILAVLRASNGTTSNVRLTAKP